MLTLNKISDIAQNKSLLLIKKLVFCALQELVYGLYAGEGRLRMKLCIVSNLNLRFRYLQIENISLCYSGMDKNICTKR